MENMMKKLLLFLMLGFCLGSFASLSKNLYINNVVAGRGCCSHHGGVCGCQSGRNLCCDGTLSPSCHCYRGDKDPEIGI